MVKMKFEIEFEVPEEIESFIGIDLKLHNANHPKYDWVQVFAGGYYASKVRDGKHLKFDKNGFTVISVGERTPEELERLKKEK